MDKLQRRKIYKTTIFGDDLELPVLEPNTVTLDERRTMPSFSEDYNVVFHSCPSLVCPCAEDTAQAYSLAHRGDTLADVSKRFTRRKMWLVCQHRVNRL